ncbi:MAG: ABC transporter ATP-binding protein [Gemmataceae bacterium]|nr:ABC transporter ATP-binding protein [Gemmataceae bacterium]
MAPVLETTSLTKRYRRGQYALVDLDLSVARGEIFGLLGPNGSGKSTTLRLLLGFIKPTRGRASVTGFDCWHDSLRVRQRVAYLPGELRLYEKMTGNELLAFLTRLRNTRWINDPIQLARQFDVDLSRPLSHLSSGMKRKIALLTVLIPKVDLIILDEPTNTLDPIMRDLLLTLLRTARDRGQTIVFSSHVLTEVEQVCDRVGILKDGRLVHLQVIQEMTERRVDVRFASLPQTWPDFVPPPRSLTHVFNYQGPLPRLLDWLAQQSILDLRIHSSGLAPIYQKYHHDLA